MSNREIAAVGTIMRAECEPEAVELMDLIQELEPSEQKELATFIQGARFAKTLNNSKESA